MPKKEYIQAMLDLGINCRTQLFLLGNGDIDALCNGSIDLRTIFEGHLLPNIHNQPSHEQLDESMEATMITTQTIGRLMKLCKKHEQVFAHIKEFHKHSHEMVRIIFF